MKKFAFVNNAAEREYKNLPTGIQKDFGVSLNAIQKNEDPFLTTSSLKSIGAGVIELKINGSPAYRCVYIDKYLDTVVVLHSFIKTTNGVDRQAMITAQQRYKKLMAEVARAKKS